jgi:hypothetical protein
MLNQSIAAIPLPDRMRSLPISRRGFPVPWFVTVHDADGDYDFRAVDPRRIGEAVRTKRCWLCGKPLGRFLVFTLGPMCAINRVSAEPPSHRACAEYAVKACPFLSHPRARRNTVDLTGRPETTPGVAIPRNPGVTLLWVTESFHVRVAETPAGGAGYLLNVGEPLELAWYA